MASGPLAYAGTRENRQVVLASRPNGKPTTDNFRLEVSPAPVPGDGQMLLKTRYLGLAPVMRFYMQATARTGDAELAIGDIMHRDPVTVSPETPTLEAIELMRGEKLSALPVVKDGKLEGILTDFDFLVVAARLLE